MIRKEMRLSVLDKYLINVIKIKKSDYGGLLIAYMGCFILTWWGIWSIHNYHLPFIDLTGFISSLGGLI